MLTTLLGSPVKRASVNDGFLSGNDVGPYFFGAKTAAGISVTHQTALQYAAVWAATRVLCEPSGAMPLITYRRTNNDDREQATDYPLYDILKSSPNDDMDAQPFWEGRFQHAINWDGGGFAEIERARDNPDSPVVALHPIHPCRVYRASKQDQDNGYYYQVRNDDGTTVLMRRDQIFHMPGVLSEDGIWSRGVIPYARQTIGFGIATEQYGATYFGEGGQPRVLITGFQAYRDREARRQFRSDWKEIHGHSAASDVGIAPPGTDVKIMSIPNEAAQFLETRVHNDRVIARWYMVPLHMIQDLERGTQASIEMVSIEFVIYHLWPWLRRCQGQASLKLIPRRDRGQYYVEHNLNTLLRGDLKSRIESYRTAIMIGIMTINEARRFENLPGIGPRGDVHYVPANMTTADVMLNNPPQPGAIGPGSDQVGGPGRASPGQMAAAIEKYLTHEQRDDLGTDIKELEKQNGHCADNKPNYRKAAKSVLRDALSRMFTKESNAAARAAKKENFDDWSRDFYDKHQVTMTEALQPAAELLATMGMSVTAESLAQQSIADSKERITAALHASPATLLGILDSWPTLRADEATDSIVGTSNV